MIIGGEELEGCFKKTYAVLTKLQELNIKVNIDKCQVFSNNIDYLEHKITSDEFIAVQKYEQAVMQCSRPENTSQLRSFWI